MKQLLKKIKILRIILFSIFCQGSHAASSSEPFLDWGNRPPDLQERIDSRVAWLRDHNPEGWPYNGAEDYNLASPPQYQLSPQAEVAKAMILTHATTQKDFFFMDIGAGRCQWGRALADYLHSQPDIQALIAFRGNYCAYY
jgi:hypothetical protein